MAANPKGETERLKIMAFETPDYSSAAIEEFEAFLNPNELTIAYEMEFESEQGQGTSGSRQNFKRVKPGDLAVTLTLDGTGATGRSLDVQKTVEAFNRVTGFNGNIHRPNYLMIMWGSIEIRRCILKGASIAYKLFRADGSPLRAVITANFTENVDDATRVATERKSSPDVTHMRVVKAGDTLPLLSYQIYGDKKYYLELARVNGLKHFTRLEPGQEIFFPPLEKAAKKVIPM